MGFLKLTGKELKWLLAVNIIVVFGINAYGHGVSSIFNPLFIAVWIGTLIKWVIVYCILRGIWRLFNR